MSTPGKTGGRCRPRLRLLCGLAIRAAALAQKKYDPGATDTEIKIGNIMPYSGPASAYGVIGKTEEAYFKKINAEGGINGRKINFITYDDAYTPPKTVEQARKLVESDEVLLIFNTLGTAAEHGDPEIPQLQEGAAAVRRHRRHQVERSEDFPWTMGWQPNYQSEAAASTRSTSSKNKPNAKIGVLYQNDDYGKDYLKGLKDGLGAKAASMIVLEESYEVSEPTIDSHIVKLKVGRRRRLHEHHHAEVRGAGDQEDRRDRLEAGALSSTTSRPRLGERDASPPGLENAQDIISAAYAKDADGSAVEGRCRA